MTLNELVGKIIVQDNKGKVHNVPICVNESIYPRLEFITDGNNASVWAICEFKEDLNQITEQIIVNIRGISDYDLIRLSNNDKKCLFDFTKINLPLEAV